MNTSRKLVAGAVLVGAVVLAPARAEVSAETNAFGQYVKTVIYASASTRNPRIWSASRLRFGRTPLNPRGDAIGDLFPVVSENAAQQRWPWVMWSRFNGHDYDLVWSRWLGAGWSPIAPVEAAPAGGDAVDASLAFSADGRAHAVWLSRGAGPAQVKLSYFLATQWMAPFPVSDVGEDAANPSMVILPDGRIEVSYDTAVAHVTKIVAFARPSTITDDISPFGNVNTTTTTSTDPAATKP
jgi:hypothetical protein